MVFSLKQLLANFTLPALRQNVQTLDVKTMTVQHTQVDVVLPTLPVLIVTINESPRCFLRVCPGFENPDVDVELPRYSFHFHKFCCTHVFSLELRVLVIFAC